MKRVFMAALAVTTMIAAPMAALAQPDRYRDDRYHDDRGRGEGRYDEHRGDFHRHEEWRRGYHMHRDEWSRGRPIDWREHHLRRPPRGYEWREVDGNWVLAAAATGLIASVIANSH